MRHFSLKQFGGRWPAASGDERGVDRAIHVETGAAAPRRRDGSLRWIVAAGVLLIAAIAAGTALLVSSLRDRALADARQVLNTTAYVVAEHMEGTFQSIELVQKSLSERMQSLDILTSEDLERRMSGVDVHLILKDMVSGVPQLEALRIVSPSGRLIASSVLWPVPERTEFEHEYFTVMTEEPSLSTFLSRPERSRRTGAWTTSFVRRLVAPSGDYIGIIVGVLELRTLEQFFGSVSGRDAVAIAMFRNDGVLLARYPRVDTAIGQSPSGPLFRDAWSVREDETQLAALQTLTHNPVVVSVSTSASAALERWLQQARIIVAAVALAASTIGGYIFLIVHRLMQGIRRSRQRLRGQKLQLDTALNNMSQGLLMCDPDDRVVLCNKRYTEIYGVPPEMVERGCRRQDLIAHHFATGILAGDAKAYVGAVMKKMSSKASYTREVETVDGRTIFINNHSAEGGIRVTTHEDISERRRAERERDRSREFLDRIIESIPVTVVVKDAHTLRYVLVNRAGEKLWGLSREQLVGRTPYEIFDRETADNIVVHDQEVMQTSAEFHIAEHPINTPRNGVRLVKSSRICVRDQNGEAQYLVGVTEDMTERKSVEEQLRQAQKMEAVGNLTGGVAHDFNNLLTVIIGNLDLLKEDVVGNEPAEHKVEAILQAAERGADLTRVMLAFSRRQPLQATRVDVNKLIRSTTRLLNRTLGEEISIEVEFGTDLAPAMVDEAQLETALLNIAINARDAMPEGGTLSILTRSATLDGDFASRHPGVTPGAYVQIEIADTGSGMPSEVIEHIFEPFFTTKGVGKGTGLGLSMVYGFMKQSNGHISVYSEVGHGTVFKLFLPVAPSDVPSPSLVPDIAPQALLHAGDAVILVVDDNPEVRATVVAQLKGFGYEVREADSAHGALVVLGATARIDLLFTDIVMPGGLNGKELATKARVNRPDLRVLFTSGFPGTSTGAGMSFDEGDLLLSKPYRKDDLAKAVAAALATQPA